jgi:hypothetical protein
VIEPVSILDVRVSATSCLEIDFSAGQAKALDLPPEIDLDANPGFVDGLKRVLRAVLAFGNDPQSALEYIRRPARSFEGKTVLEMIAAGRTDDVLNYLQSFSAGYVG